MTDPPTVRLRPGQRRRTRKAIVDATIALLADGGTPSVAAIAEAAEVSRRTVYLYFPTLEQLYIDATVGALSLSSVGEAIEAAQATTDDPAAGIEALARAMCRQSDETKQLGRRLVRLTAERAVAEGEPRRGYRRIEWIESAIEPLRMQLGEAAFERLISALAIVIGWEAFVVLQDVRGIDAAAQEDAIAWAARVLVEAAVAEAT